MTNFSFYLKISDSDHILNRPNLNGLRPLYVAARNGNIRAVEFLLEKKCNIELESRGETALAVASRWGQAQVVQMMLKKEIDMEVMRRACRVAANNKIKKMFYDKGVKESVCCCEMI